MKKSINSVFVKIVVLIMLSIIYNSVKAQTPISKYLIGQNAWGTGEIFEVFDDIKSVHYQSIRIGGNGYENSGFMNKDVVKYIDYARSVGAEPIVQMPRQLEDDDKAFKAISYLNGTLKKNIKYWSIGNEPDHHNQLSSPEEVFGYFTKIATQIKKYDPEAKIMGFDLSSYKGTYINRLIGGDLDITQKVPNQNYYYLDIVSFHNYKFKDITGFEKDVKDLKQLLKPINSKRAENQRIGWAITEFNSHWIVDESLGEDFLPYNFHNGQIFAEMYDLGMREGAFTICPWSILEGGADREGTDLGMFDLINGKYVPRSNYYHTQMLGQNFRKNYLNHQNTKKEITVIPMGDKDGISVMIINKNKSNGFEYKLQLNRSEEIGNEHLIAIDAKLKILINAKIGAATTQMLIFNKNGKLIKKYNYSAKDAELKKPPTIEIF